MISSLRRSPDSLSRRSAPSIQFLVWSSLKTFCESPCRKLAITYFTDQRGLLGLRNRHGTGSNTITIWLESTNFHNSSEALQIHTRNLNLNHCGSLSLANCSLTNAPVI